jgi:hypothetical protein
MKLSRTKWLSVSIITLSCFVTSVVVFGSEDSNTPTVGDAPSLTAGAPSKLELQRMPNGDLEVRVNNEVPRAPNLGSMIVPPTFVIVTYDELDPYCQNSRSDIRKSILGHPILFDESAGFHFLNDGFLQFGDGAAGINTEPQGIFQESTNELLPLNKEYKRLGISSENSVKPRTEIHDGQLNASKDSDNQSFPSAPPLTSSAKTDHVIKSLKNGAVFIAPEQFTEFNCEDVRISLRKHAVAFLDVADKAVSAYQISGGFGAVSIFVHGHRLRLNDALVCITRMQAATLADTVKMKMVNYGKVTERDYRDCRIFKANFGIAGLLARMPLVMEKLSDPVRCPPWLSNSVLNSIARQPELSQQDEPKGEALCADLSNLKALDEQQVQLFQKICHEPDAYFYYAQPEQYQLLGVPEAKLSKRWSETEKEKMRKAILSIMQRVPGLILSATGGNKIALVRTTSLDRQELLGSRTGVIFVNDLFFQSSVLIHPYFLVHELLHQADTASHLSLSREWIRLARQTRATENIKQNSLENTKLPDHNSAPSQSNKSISETFAYYFTEYIFPFLLRVNTAETRRFSRQFLCPSDEEMQFNAHYIRGQLAFRTGALQEAREEYLTARSLKPSVARVYLGLAGTYHGDLANLELSRKYCTKACELFSFANVAPTEYYFSKARAGRDWAKRELFYESTHKNKEE